MNVSISNAHQVSLKSSALQSVYRSEAPSAQQVSDSPMKAHDADHLLPSESLQHHGLSPLKVVGLHGAVMAVEHGIHFSLHKSVQYADRNASQGSTALHTLGDVTGAAAAGYLAYQAINHALHAAASGNKEATAAYSLSAVLDAGLAVANTLAVFKQTPSVTVGVSLGIGLLSTASSALGAKLEQTKPQE